ncbi:uncharacterized protein LOC129726563 [Wyeomyia smithii]|uniref:uncharacterized protein LOC129726563 n=1 Tax=Wyeomyia smithii TaxID=174621 RepID=UPI0024680520|nr:uncharacterized protein LOC129726563 [Wyeomyia smithii]
MVLDPSPFTGSPKECAKGMEAIMHFKNGWVKNLSAKKIGNKFVTHGIVHHSFSLNEKPLRTWIISHEDGTIMAAHCDCAIGIMEACSHIGATLFALEGIRTAVLEKKLSVTDLPAYWKKPPKSVTTDLYKKLKDVDFGRKIKRTFPYHCAQGAHVANSKRQVALLKCIVNDGLNVAATSQFCGEANLNFLCTDCTYDLQIQVDLKKYNLQLLYDPKNTEKSRQQLRRLALSIYAAMEREPVKLHQIEAITTKQKNNKWWFIFRSGRITASVWKEICSTTIAKPSVTLLRRVCYPETVQFSTPSTRYGHKYEETAIEELFVSVADMHDNLIKQKSGLVICEEEPCLGASPDAIFSCSCHGSIVVEVKCPFSARDCNDIIPILTQLRNPYVFKDHNGNIHLNTEHKYYYQAVMQVHVCQASFGYFCIWSPKQKIIFKIERNEQFWKYHKENSVNIFKYVILPELLSRNYTVNSDKEKNKENVVEENCYKFN